MKSLEKIIKKYSEISYNTDNYSVGGGLHNSGKMASNRHEDALSDAGKLTLGKATQMFCKATGLETEFVKEILKYAVPNMEWHHAGFMPKQYGGGMKKTYFLNALEIVEVAVNFQSYINKIEISKEAKRVEIENAKNRDKIKEGFLMANATKVVRIENKPKFFYEIDREMNGKFGWFSSYGKSYNMTEYFTGWVFETEEMYSKFLDL